uniref:Vomeronasal type 2 receptor n=1 Tax=Cacopsylla melanoneura TaxID=428564 RepID=A0A8D8ZM38_9HEMI
MLPPLIFTEVWITVLVLVSNFITIHGSDRDSISFKGDMPMHIFKGSVYYDNLFSQNGLNNTMVFLHAHNGCLYSDTHEYLQCKLISEMSRQLALYVEQNPVKYGTFTNSQHVYDYWNGIKHHCAAILFDYYNKVAFKIWHTIKYKSKVLRNMGNGLHFVNKTRRQILEHWYLEENLLNRQMNKTVTDIRSFMRDIFMSWSKGPFRVCAGLS